MSKPFCKKCESEHFNFDKCLPRQDVKPAIEWRSNETKWGDRFIDLKHLGGNTFVQRREGDR